MFKKAAIWLTLLSLGLSTGCASKISYRKDLFQYQPARIASNKRIDKVVGLNLLLDKRPEEERMRLPPDPYIFESVAERVTLLFLEDFKKSHLFKEIHFPAQATDDLIIDGVINRFFWEQWEQTFWGDVYSFPLTAIFPIIALPVFLGAPTQREYCIIDISLEIKDNKNNEALAQIRESSKSTQGISFYGPRLLGKDVTEAFCSVTDKLKKELVEKITPVVSSKMTEGREKE